MRAAGAAVIPAQMGRRHVVMAVANSDDRQHSPGHAGEGRHPSWGRCHGHVRWQRSQDGPRPAPGWHRGED